MPYHTHVQQHTRLVGENTLGTLHADVQDTEGDILRKLGQSLLSRCSEKFGVHPGEKGHTSSLRTGSWVVESRVWSTKSSISMLSV